MCHLGDTSRNRQGVVGHGSPRGPVPGERRPGRRDDGPVVERQRVADVLTGLGWCLLAGYLALVVSQVNDVREFNQEFAQSFAEQVSLVAQIVYPISTLILVLAAVAALASQLVRAGNTARTPWRAVPLAWAAIGVAALAGVTLVFAVWSLTEVEGGANRGVQLVFYLGSGAVIAAVPLAARLAIRLEPLPPSRHLHPDHHGHHRPTSPFSQPPTSQ